MKTGMIRQGDVLLRPRKAGQTIKGKAVEAVDGRTILARGEGHNHSHSLPFGGAVLYRDSDGSAVLEVTKDSKLQHLFGLKTPTGDHADLDVPAGEYDVIQQHGLSPDQAPDTRVYD